MGISVIYLLKLNNFETSKLYELIEIFGMIFKYILKSYIKFNLDILSLRHYNYIFCVICNYLFYFYVRLLKLKDKNIY